MKPLDPDLVDLKQLYVLIQDKFYQKTDLKIGRETLKKILSAEQEVILELLMRNKKVKTNLGIFSITYRPPFIASKMDFVTKTLNNEKSERAPSLTPKITFSSSIKKLFKELIDVFPKNEQDQIKYNEYLKKRKQFIKDKEIEAKRNIS
jgi:hypothetical protein